MKSTVKRRIGSSSPTALTFLFAAMYMVGYITRLNYGAVIAEMVTASGFSKSALSAAVTGSFISYGAGQIVSGFMGDRISPKKLITCGLIVTTGMNLLIPFCPDPISTCAVWCINGFAQSFLWPPLVKLMTGMVDKEQYKKTSTIVSFAASVGTVVVYLAAPVLISIGSWKTVFFACAACGGIMTLIWTTLLDEPDFSPAKKVEKERTNPIGSLFTPLFFLILIAVVLQGMLRDGVTTWMPSYVAETYGLSNAVSILTGVVLPLFGIICMQFASKLYRSVMKNPVSCAAVLFVAGAASSLALYLISGKSAAVSVLCAAILAGCMHGINLLLICMVPPIYAGNGNVSAVSGIVNACTYVGSALSTYGTAVFSDKIGWHKTLLLWCAIACAGTLICTLCIRPLNKKIRETSKPETEH